MANVGGMARDYGPMTTIHHLDCGLLETGLGRACCHCLGVMADDRVVLVDTGIGLLDCADPSGRLGQELIDAAGFRFDEARTAVRQLEAIGIDRSRVTDVILTHADPDHTGGLADFPHARVHVSSEVLAAVSAGEARYRHSHFEHNPTWIEHAASGDEWYGLPVRQVLPDMGISV